VFFDKDFLKMAQNLEGYCPHYWPQQCFYELLGWASIIKKCQSTPDSQ